MSLDVTQSSPEEVPELCNTLTADANVSVTERAEDKGTSSKITNGCCSAAKSGAKIIKSECHVPTGCNPAAALYTETNLQSSSSHLHSEQPENPPHRGELQHPEKFEEFRDCSRLQPAESPAKFQQDCSQGTHVSSSAGPACERAVSARLTRSATRRQKALSEGCAKQKKPSQKNCGDVSGMEKLTLRGRNQEPTSKLSIHGRPARKRKRPKFLGDSLSEDTDDDERTQKNVSRRGKKVGEQKRKLKSESVSYAATKKKGQKQKILPPQRRKAGNDDGHTKQIVFKLGRKRIKLSMDWPRPKMKTWKSREQKKKRAAETRVIRKPKVAKKEYKPGKASNMKIGTGLKNLGNSCYVNAVVQALRSVRLFNDFIRTRVFEACSLPEHPKNPILTKKEAIAASKKSVRPRSRESGACKSWLLTAEMHRLLNEMELEECAAISPDRLCNAVWQLLPPFKSYDQQDAHEFLSFFLDSLENELKRSSGDMDSSERRRRPCNGDSSQCATDSSSTTTALTANIGDLVGYTGNISNQYLVKTSLDTSITDTADTADSTPESAASNTIHPKTICVGSNVTKFHTNGVLIPSSIQTLNNTGEVETHTTCDAVSSDDSSVVLVGTADEVSVCHGDTRVHQKALSLPRNDSSRLARALGDPAIQSTDFLKSLFEVSNYVGILFHAQTIAFMIA